MRHVGHLPRIITWCTVNKMYKTVPFFHIFIPKCCIHFAYLAHSTYNILLDRYTCQRRVTWRTRQRSCGAMCSELNKHKLEFSLRVKHKPIKEFKREGQNGVNDEQYPRQTRVCHIISIWHHFSTNVTNRLNSDYEFCSGEAFTIKIITVWEELHNFYYCTVHFW
jgi:hypothetical protein